MKLTSKTLSKSIAVTKQRQLVQSVDGNLEKIHLETHSDVVVLPDGDNLSARLDRIALKEDIGTIAADAAQAEVAKIVSGAPETMDTLKEVADAFEENKTVVDALNNAIGNKVDQVPGASLMTEEERNKLSQLENYVHPEKHNASEIDTTEDKQFVSQSEKQDWSSRAKIKVSEELPTDLQDGEFCMVEISQKG